ncbi:hypothetical protein E7742_20555 [Rhodococcus sp. SGAir0479]|nr:hypothetical protein E7742_20555 [Rhodococcus sp. SGAir0479]
MNICMTRPVRAPCRDHALRKPQRFGIGGGPTPTERLRMRRQALQLWPSVSDGALLIVECGRRSGNGSGNA